jgi:LemA protein
MEYWLLGIVGLLVVGAIWIYNGLVRSRNEVENGWAQIDVQLRRRHDLIPNLVATVRGARDFEAEVLTELTERRSQAMTAAVQVGAMESALSTALGGFLAVMENYPDLKSGQNFLALQEELASTENRIAFARQAFNDAVALYNTRRETFPGVLLAGGFPRREFLTIEPVARAVPDATV